jgi:UDP-glucuronate decarboxylase
MQRVLVTHGAGLVGSHLCDRLIGEGLEVVAVDDLARGSFANVAHLEHEPRFVLEEHDLRDPFDADVDAFVHLAHEGPAFFSTVIATARVLELAAARGAPVVLVSPSERSSSAGLVEGLARRAARAHRLDARIVRLPLAYGPRMSPDIAHPVSMLTLQALRGEPLAFPERPAARRLTYVADAVDAVVRTLLGGPRPLGVAPFVEATTAQIAAAVAGAAGASLASWPVPQRAEGTSSRLTDRGSPEERGPACAATPLPAGIGCTVRYFEERLRVGPSRRTSGIFCRGDAARQNVS